MFVRTFESPGLAHFSYLVGDGSEAAVIDPQRDIDGYLTAACEIGARITHVFETHRNEDYVTGTSALVGEIGADVYHGFTELHPFSYGQTVKDNDVFRFGNALLRALKTPGHTLDSLSFVLMDAGISPTHALGVFTGDTLLIGGVGRCDFYPDRAEQVAGLLHASLFEKLLPLGDQCLVFQRMAPVRSAVQASLAVDSRQSVMSVCTTGLCWKIATRLSMQSWPSTTTIRRTSG